MNEPMVWKFRPEATLVPPTFYDEAADYLLLNHECACFTRTAIIPARGENRIRWHNIEQ